MFLCHSSQDKPFVRRLAVDLGNQGIGYWLDEAELNVGDSLIEKLRLAIDEVDYLIAVISPASVASPWVARELDVAMTQEILGRRVKVMPLLLEKCELPGFLPGKVYADFTEESTYLPRFQSLVRSIGIVFSQSSFDCAPPAMSLGRTTAKAWEHGMPLARKPFHRPLQYVGMTVSDAAAEAGALPNAAGNIVVDSADLEMVLEAEGSCISYVDVRFKRTAGHPIAEPFNSEVLLGALSIGMAELELARSSTHCHVYYHHGRRLKISAICHGGGEPLAVGFSAKYYGE